MKIPDIIPSPAAIGREAIIVVGGALLAAMFMSQLPSLKAYIKQAWA